MGSQKATWVMEMARNNEDLSICIIKLSVISIRELKWIKSNLFAFAIGSFILHNVSTQQFDHVSLIQSFVWSFKMRTTYMYDRLIEAENISFQFIKLVAWNPRGILAHSWRHSLFMPSLLFWSWTFGLEQTDPLCWGRSLTYVCRRPTVGQEVEFQPQRRCCVVRLSIWEHFLCWSHLSLGKQWGCTLAAMLVSNRPAGHFSGNFDTQAGREKIVKKIV